RRRAKQEFCVPVNTFGEQVSEEDSVSNGESAEESTSNGDKVDVSDEEPATQREEELCDLIVPSSNGNGDSGNTTTPSTERDDSVTGSEGTEEKISVAAGGSKGRGEPLDNQELFRAVKQGDVIGLRTLLRTADLQATDEGYTLLHLACLYNIPELVTALFYFTNFTQLIDKSVDDPSDELFHGKTAIRIARYEKNWALVRKLEEYSALENQLTDLHRAARAGDFNKVVRLCEQDTEVNSFVSYSITPLYMATSAGHLDVVKTLVDWGADINIRNSRGDTFLHRAASWGHYDVADYLITTGIESCDIDSLNQNHETPLHRAVSYNHIDIAQLLLHNGADPNVLDRYGTSLLHLAIANSYTNLVDLLLQTVPSLILNGDGYAPLHMACMNNDAGTVRALLRHSADVNIRERQTQQTPLHISVDRGHEGIVSYLCRCGADTNLRDRFGFLPLVLAVAHNDEAIVQILTQHGSSVNAAIPERPHSMEENHAQSEHADQGFENNFRRSQKARNQKLTALHLAAENGYSNIVKILVESGARIDAKDIIGRTPFHMAATKGKLEVVKYFVHKGIFLDMVTNKNNTCLHLAAKGSHLGVVKYLLKRGAGANALTMSLQTPLHLAACQENIDIVVYVLKYGAQIDAVDLHDWTALYYAAQNGQDRVIRLLVANGAQVEGVKDRETPLHVAGSRGHLECVKVLLELGANVGVKDSNTLTTLHRAANAGHHDVVTVLIGHGADVNMADADGLTPLHLASMKDNIDVVRCLVENSADINAEDKYRTTPLHIASTDGQLSVTDYLVRRAPTLMQKMETASHLFMTQQRTGEVKLLMFSSQQVPRSMPGIRIG
ncbi:LOW QUALITY PROTEIN: ankyrin-3-like, partial [Ptychodera flava]|uniref:LOW QUALITY PROTEIN: ankyrin-3-like n=1 Tax=Ptychodera flava TaxID=63121 RepID=UPI00396A44F4